MRKFFNDEAGFIVSAELVLIITVMFCGVSVGVIMVRDALVGELSDVSEAIGALNQSYNFRGINAASTANAAIDHARCTGSGYNDDIDECDCKGVTFNVVTGKTDPSGLGTDEGL